MSVERNIRYDLIARLCPNATGAELRSVCTEAGMFAIRARRKVASEKDFLVGRDASSVSSGVDLIHAGLGRKGHPAGQQVFEHGGLLALCELAWCSTGSVAHPTPQN
jgi:SpoVK/Ycf46/Vps4 family AAA+-type ATPase